MQDLLHSPLNIDDSVMFPSSVVFSLTSWSRVFPKKSKWSRLIANGTSYLRPWVFIYYPLYPIQCNHLSINQSSPIYFVIVSLIVPLFKSGNKDTQSPNSYRDILLSSKIFERLILNLLHPGSFPWFTTSGCFRPGYSTFHSSFMMSVVITECKQKNYHYILPFSMLKSFWLGMSILQVISFWYPWWHLVHFISLIYSSFY